jgi:hypothetical protein
MHSRRIPRRHKCESICLLSCGVSAVRFLLDFGATLFNADGSQLSKGCGAPRRSPNKIRDVDATGVIYFYKQTTNNPRTMMVLFYFERVQDAASPALLCELFVPTKRTAATRE